ncbi:MAG: triose-phosphate isomerase [Burkholderiales bacterium RIFCSPLOWO2_12_FULL_64_99]|jgi:triosephosphate isomerase|nr:MAG: triose-phosphate isomerase [Burkholderiales bacterium RIFCSPHIGHO2_12_FULL_63_20]OGB65129.1 MAG: triose-phosphate isomerase [Burkholderiales bacterium RIFCSPLOWO2_12_FULL_64_99]
MSVMKKLVVGNWKMHGSRAFNAELIQGLLVADLATTAPHADVAVCPPFVFLADVADALQGSAIAVGTQDISAQTQGAYTGEVAGPMIREFGATYAIVGHSERRSYHAESDQLVADKAKAALSHGLVPIVCVGETLAEREADQTEAVVGRQLQAVIDTLGEDITRVVVAYEPVWAIGTGKTASPAQAQAVHASLRAQLAKATSKAADIPLLYGGSVKPDNAVELFSQPDINGGLIGGAALKAADFAAIARAA